MLCKHHHHQTPGLPYLPKPELCPLTITLLSVLSSQPLAPTVYFCPSEFDCSRDLVKVESYSICTLLLWVDYDFFLFMY